MELLDIKPITKTFELLAPGTMDEVGVELTITSYESEEVKSIHRQMNLEVARNPKLANDADRAERYGIKIFAAVIVGWKWREPRPGAGVPKLNGVATPALTDENKRALVSAGWVQRQLAEELEDVASFFPGGQKA